MRVRVIRNSFVNCPSEMITAGFSAQSEVRLQIGDLHEVFAISFFSGVVFVCVLDDLSIFVWLPAWLFEVADPSVPNDWKAGLFNDDPAAVIGPDFLVCDKDGYVRMVEQDPELIAKMKDRELVDPEYD